MAKFWVWAIRLVTWKLTIWQLYIFGFTALFKDFHTYPISYTEGQNAGREATKLALKIEQILTTMT